MDFVTFCRPTNSTVKPTTSHSSQEGLRLTFNNLNDLQNTIVSLYNPETREFTWFNHLTQSHLGYEPKDLINRTLNFWLSLVHAQDLEKIRTLFMEGKNDITACLPGQRNQMEYRLKHKNGQWVFVCHEQQIITLKNKAIVVNLIVDLTEKEMLHNYFSTSSNNGRGKRMSIFQRSECRFGCFLPGNGSTQAHWRWPFFERNSQQTLH